MLALHWKSSRRPAFELKTPLMLHLRGQDNRCRMRRARETPSRDSTWIAWLCVVQPVTEDACGQHQARAQATPVTEDAFSQHQARAQATPQERVFAAARSDSGLRPVHHDPEET